MWKSSVALALTLLVVGPGLAGVHPSGATGVAASDERVPPNLPEQWRETYGGSGDDIFADLVRTDDGGYLLVGWRGGENRQGWVLKIDGDGNEAWSKTLGGSGTDRFWGVARTEDGYLLAGRTDDGGVKGWVVELSPDGEVRRERTLGPGAFYAVAREGPDDDSGHLLAGWTRGDGVEGWTVKLESDGTEAWRASFPAPEGYRKGYLRAVVPTASGYFLAGKVEGDSADAWALKIGPDGTREWQTTAGGPNRDDVWAAAPADGGFVVAGETESDSTGPRDGWLVKVADDGGVEWERRLGGEGTQWLDSAMRTGDGFLFTGSSTAGPNRSADGYVLATDADGTTRWEAYYGTDGWDKPWPAVRAHGGGYLLAGQTSGDGSAGKDGWLLKIGEESATTRESASETDASAEVQTTDSSDEATDEAKVADTATATRGSDGGVPGFGAGAALLALAAVLLLRSR